MGTSKSYLDGHEITETYLISNQNNSHCKNRRQSFLGFTMVYFLSLYLIKKHLQIGIIYAIVIENNYKTNNYTVCGYLKSCYPYGWQLSLFYRDFDFDSSSQ